MSKHWIYRHAVLVRGPHALNVFCFMLLLMSGLQIFNAHPALYWGHQSAFDRPVFSIFNSFTSEGRPIGVTSVMGATFETTGLLGWSRLNGRPGPRAFPGWATVPSMQDLAMGRRWHFFFAWLFAANGLLYLAYSLVSAHLSRDLLPHKGDWAAGGGILGLLPWRHRPQYNVIQRLTYVTVVAILAPLVVVTGLAMSPAVGAAAPWLSDALGGRQSARTLHFVLTWVLVAFAIVHVILVAFTGLLNNLRSMITGWYAVDGEASNP